jgi:hypothetical protein
MRRYNFPDPPGMNMARMPRFCAVQVVPPDCVYIVPVETDEFRCACDGRLQPGLDPRCQIGNRLPTVIGVVKRYASSP